MNDIHGFVVTAGIAGAMWEAANRTKSAPVACAFRSGAMILLVTSFGFLALGLIPLLQ